MNEEILRMYIRAFLKEEKQTLGEPDTTAEKMRDEPQPQYEEEEEEASGDKDESSTVAGMGSGLGPAMPLEYDPEKPVYDPYASARSKEDEDDKKKK